MVAQFEDGAEAESLGFTNFTSKLEADWFDDRDKKLVGIRDLWRRIERMTIGAYHSNLVNRIRAKDRVFTQALLTEADGDEALVDAIGSVVSETAEDLFNRLAERWLPVAQEFIQDLRATNILNTNRAPKSLWLKSQSGKRVSEVIGAWLSDPGAAQFPTEEIWGKQDYVPHDIFGSSAALALYAHEWSQAEQFADLARRSAIAHHAGNETRSELLYMRALAKRFLFASDEWVFQDRDVSPETIQRRRLDVIKESFLSAEKALNEAETFLRKCEQEEFFTRSRIRLEIERTSLEFMKLLAIYNWARDSEAKGATKDLKTGFKRLESAWNDMSETTGRLRNELMDQLVATLGAGVCIYALFHKGAFKKGLVPDGMIDLVLTDTNCSEEGTQDFSLLAIIRTSVSIILNGPNHDCETLMRTAAEEGQRETLRLPFDAIFTNELLSQFANASSEGDSQTGSDTE